MRSHICSSGIGTCGLLALAQVRSEPKENLELETWPLFPFARRLAYYWIAVLGSDDQKDSESQEMMMPRRPTSCSGRRDSASATYWTAECLHEVVTVSNMRITRSTGIQFQETISL